MYTMGRPRARPHGIEEEGSEEYASDHQGTKPASEEHHVEPAVLVQPLGGEGADEGVTLSGSAVPLCKAGSEGPCARDAKGGPGAACHSAEGKRNCRRRIEHLKNGTGSEKENIEACGILGGGIGGAFGGFIGDLPGGFAGGIAGQKAAEKLCKAL
jgi:hypothetical protein